MKLDSIKRLAVIGAGIMGPGIALEFARFGHNVSLHDINPKSLDSAMELIKDDLSLMVEMQLITPENEHAALLNIIPEPIFEKAVKDVEYVVEAIPEKLGLKWELFSRLEKNCSPDTVLASNSSGLTATQMAKKAKWPHRILVTHYFSPPHFIPLVEIFGGEQTSPDVVSLSVEFLKCLNKKVVLIKNEKFRQMGNLLQSALAIEIHRLVDMGASPYEIDDIITYGFGRRLPFQGYFKRMDIVGLDGRMDRHIATGKKPWQPIKDKIDKGELGVKTGKGFYEWPKDAALKEYRKMNRELIRLMKLDQAAE